MASDNERIHRLLNRFSDLFGSDEKPRVFSAPGRVNIIGEHTDYNGGFVLPIAIERNTLVACAPSGDETIRIFSVEFEEMGEFSLRAGADGLARDQQRGWLNYPMGVAWCLLKAGHDLRGVNCVVQGNVPIGGGLSSSASIEVAFALAFCSAAGIKMDKRRLALLCQKAENEFVGVSCGIMDQYVSLHAEEGHAVLIDCKSITHETVPIPDGAGFVICNTGVKRELTGSEYNERRADCEEAARLLGAPLLRDVSLEQFEREAERLPERIRKRARHVITEDERTLKAVEALRKGDLHEVGGLMNESHESLRRDYEVTCRELDIMVEIARSIDGTYGARMTGAGFGGCTVNLVASYRIDDFVSRISREYAERTGIEPSIIVSRAAGGAREITDAA